MKRPTCKTASRNSFYLKIYRKAWNIQHEILYRKLQEGRAVRFSGTGYGIPEADIVRLYEQFLSRVRLLRDLQRVKKSRMIRCRTSKARIKEILHLRLESALLNRDIAGSAFVFTKRMRNMLRFLELNTIGELTQYPLNEYMYFRGFKRQCMKELIDFIEFENLQRHFKGFGAYKKEYYRKWSRG